MPDKIMPGPVSECGNVREAVCIHTRKIYDSCREWHHTISRKSPGQARGFLLIRPALG